MEVQGSKFPEIGLVHVYIQTLTLVDVASTVNSHIHQCLLLDFPYSSDAGNALVQMNNNEKEMKGKQKKDIIKRIKRKTHTYKYLLVPQEFLEFSAQSHSHRLSGS